MRRTANSEGVVRALLESDWGHTHAVARSTGLNRETVSRVLRRLADEGLAVVRSSGPRREYALTDAGRRLADEWQLLPDPSQPARYRRRRIVVEALRYDGTNLDHVRALCGADLIEDPDGSLRIRTLHQPMLLEQGMWVIKAPWGERYPIQPSVFSEGYEPA